MSCSVPRLRPAPCRGGLRPSVARPPAGPARSACLGILLAALLPGPVAAQIPPPPAASASLPAVQLEGHYEATTGQGDAASAGAVTRRLIANRPVQRPAEVLEFVPGLVVTQHSGDGKANQYFLRGFNLDHGTDFATFVDGMPVNAVSHAHGQGYTDLNFLIPELVRRIDYRKGPYAAEDGDFASAGSARIVLLDRLDHGFASVTLGPDGYRRLLAADSVEGPGGHWLAAAEGFMTDGPWTVPQRLRKSSLLLRHRGGTPGLGWRLGLMHYDNRWTATDQIPARAVAEGRLGRFDSLDPSSGGRTERFSLNAGLDGETADGDWQLSAYWIRSRLNLWSNFTYALDFPTAGDQFEQAERRQTLGGEARRSWAFTAGGRAQRLSLGGQIRHDRLDPVGLYRTVERRRLATTTESELDQTIGGLHAELATVWSPRFRSVLGLRHDRAQFGVARSSVPENTGRARDQQTSPKLALIWGPWAGLADSELFLNAGRGFHSNDARGTVARIDPVSGDPVERVPGLVASRGTEIGWRGQPLAGQQTALVLWTLRLDSELVYIGDAGTTEALGASRRRGLELNHHGRLEGWTILGTPGRDWLIDLDLAWSRARFERAPAGADHVPGAANRVASFGLGWAPEGRPWQAQFQLRHIGPRDLTEDGRQRSASTTLGSLRLGWQAHRALRLGLDVFNLFDRKASDIDYVYTSRLPGEPAAGVEGRHFHPVEPRSLRLTATLRWD